METVSWPIGKKIQDYVKPNVWPKKNIHYITVYYLSAHIPTVAPLGSTVVSIHTTCFDKKKLHYAYRVIISIYSINQLVFAIEMHHVFCEVGAEFIYIILMNLMLQRVNRFMTFSIPLLPHIYKTETICH
jgi:hypothetical protein